MNVVIFGLSISSSWGNGHATLWRGLCRALVQRGHRVVFFERDVPYYARHRDLHGIEGGALVLYDEWSAAARMAREELAAADVAIVTSYCPDALAAEELAGESDVVRVFYDLDTGVTLDRLSRGEPVEYVGPEGLCRYDLVLSYTGGRALDRLREQLGAASVAPLYGSVDPTVHRPAGCDPVFRSDLSYLATYAADRHDLVLGLLVAPASRLPEQTFLIGGPQYPLDFPWRSNIRYMEHVAPCDHPLFYASCRATLNLTRAAMAAMGFCPSGRMFEAAATGAAMLTDAWPGLERFFEPGREVLVVESAQDVIDALRADRAMLRRVARHARERVLAEHTADVRARELEVLLESAALPARNSVWELQA